MLWLALKVDDGTVRWASFESDFVEENLSERFLIAMLLLVGLAVGASALIAHRLARPLEALRARIAANDVSGGPRPMLAAKSRRSMKPGGRCVSRLINKSASARCCSRVFRTTFAVH